MDASRFHRIAKALADPRRFEILEQLSQCGGELCCGEVVARFSVKQATISHHLKELTDAGLIEIRPEGQFRYFRPRPEVLAEYIEELQRRMGLQRTGRTTNRPNRRARSTAKR
jgi:ArsR family transcriptional regulator